MNGYIKSLESEKCEYYQSILRDKKRDNTSSPNTFVFDNVNFLRRLEILRYQVTMRFLLLILTALLCFAIESHGSLSLHSDNLVQMFTDYLANLEQRQMDRFIHSRKRAVGDEKPEYLRICTGRKDCGSVVQNFGFMYDHDSGMEMCNRSYVTKADGITCFDKYPSCRYLRDEFSVCENQEVADRLGCDLTCGKCQPAKPNRKNEESIVLY